ncbi:MAG: recombinase family protein [Alphaproteobacteria bacterium]|nr:recombinase family protein [Alphaproteobacteria bacterium]
MRKKYQKKIVEKCTDAIIFTRVSSEKQEKGASIDAQKESIYNYCTNHKLNIVKEYEITESTMKGDRKKYKEMLSFVQKYPKTIAIVVNCVDRLQRSDRDNNALDDLRRDGKIEVHFLKENMVLTKDSRGDELLFWKMNVLMANSYVLSLSYNVKRSLKLLREQGVWPGEAPLGYLNKRDDNNKAIIVLDPIRAPIIQRLFSEYATGAHSLKTICQLAKELGLSSKRKKRAAAFISRNALYDVLTNPFYYGEMCIKGEFYKHIYPPLISKELFDQVQNQFVGNGNHNRNNTAEYSKTPYIFRKLIHCKECGCLITPETKVKKSGKRYTYLRCAHPNKNCHQGIVNENVILEQIKNEVLNKISLPPKLQELLQKHLIKQLNDTAQFNTTLKSNITKQLTELKIKEDKLLDFYLEGKLSQATYEEKQAQIIQERQELETTAEKYKIIDANMKANVNKIVSMAGNILYIFEQATTTDKQKLLSMLITDCQLNGTKLEYTICKPFDKLIQCADYTQWPMIAVEHLDEFENIKI